MKDLLIENLPRLRRFAYSLTGDMSDADDLVQNTIERLLSKSHSMQTSTLNLVFTVCKNLWIDEVRKRQVRRADEFKESNHSTAAPNQVSDEGLVEINELIAAVNALPESASEVLSLVAIAGFTYSEAAQILNIPIGTVMSRISRARALLVSKLKTDEISSHELH